MRIRFSPKILTFFIASVWFVNGLFCKVLNWVPRHEQIVANLFGQEYARTIIVWIGILEVVLAIWILSGYKSKWSAWIQMVVVAIMNIIEWVWVRELLLWDSWNLLFASIFIALIFINQFHFKKYPKTQT